MNEIAASQGASPEVLDARALGRKLADAFRARVDQYKYELELSTPEAVAKAEQPCSSNEELKVLLCRPEEVGWEDLLDLNRRNPERALRRFEEIKAAALEQVRSGHFAGACVQRPDTPAPWQQAIFLAFRAELANGWQPRNGIERQLIDMMAQAQVGVFYWQTVFFDQTDFPERAAASAEMADRYIRKFLALLRGLVNLRKVPPAVFVQNAQQVNFGQQQANGQNGDRKRRRKARKAPSTPEACTCLADRRSLFGEIG